MTVYARREDRGRLMTALSPTYRKGKQMNLRRTLSEVVSTLTETWDQICLGMAAEPPEIAEFSNWSNVIDREVGAILEECGWTREGVLDALHERVSDKWLAESGMIDMLCCCEV